MPSTTHQDELLRSVLELSPAAQDRVIADLREQDGTAADAISSEVRLQRLEPSFLQEALDDQFTDVERSVLAPDDLVDRYRICEKLGQGGMGEVYLAERVDLDLTYRVALKVVSASSVDVLAHQRLNRERQILADLEHPNIARLMDAGSLQVDQRTVPYLAMEYVVGRPIVEYCIDPADTRKATRPLDREQRIALFQRVLDAISFAHSHLIIHRDIKSSNVLVDESGSVKVLDFGLAKLLASEHPALELTQPQQLLFTPKIAAPEQFSGASGTAATDIYQLGRLLYELICGAPAFDLEGQPIHQMLQIITATQPTSPSRRSGEGLDLDLDAIVFKCLEVNPDDRYQSVSSLAADVQSLLDHRPIIAQRQTRWYRGRKFLRRNPLLVAGLVGASVMTSGYLVSLYQQNAETARALDSARAEAERANQTTQFLVDLFSDALPSSPAQAGKSARDLLARGTDRLERHLADQPQTHLTIANAIGEIHASLGLHAENLELLSQVIDLEVGSASDRARTLHLYANTLAELDRFEEAAPFYTSAISLLGDETLALEKVDVLIGEALLRQYQRQYAKADAIYQEAQVLLDSQGEGDSATAAQILSNRGVAAWHVGELARSEEILEQALAMRRKHLGHDHWMVALTMSNLAATKRSLGQLDAAKNYHLEALSIQERVLGEVHPHVASTAIDLGYTYMDLGDGQSAVEWASRALAINTEVYGAESLRSSNAWYALGYIKRAHGDLEGALSAHSKSIGIITRLFGDDHPSFGLTLIRIARIEHDMGRSEQAERTVDRALALVGDHSAMASTGLLLKGELLAAKGEMVAAREALTQSLQIRQRLLPAGHDKIEEVARVLDVVTR